MPLRKTIGVPPSRHDLQASNPRLPSLKPGRRAIYPCDSVSTDPATLPMNPQPSKNGKRHIWTRRQIAMLGTITDAALSRKLDLCVGTVLKKRQKLGIPASRPLKTINWTPDVIT